MGVCGVYTSVSDHNRTVQLQIWLDECTVLYVIESISFSGAFYITLICIIYVEYARTFYISSLTTQYMRVLQGLYICIIILASYIVSEIYKYKSLFALKDEKFQEWVHQLQQCDIISLKM